jgi:hypothetical protein
LDLPSPPEFLGRVEIDGHVEAVAHQLRVITEQTFDDDNVARLDQLGRVERPMFVTVHGLENRIAVHEVVEVLLHDVDVVAIWMQRGDVALLALFAVVTMVVVGAQGRHTIGTEDFHDAVRQRCFSRGRITNDAEQDRSNPARGR